ncbi:amidohydrolase family protein [Ruegeria sp. SCP11]|uniref:amidohydrolase family protein n=1 Tax=Ruegeria sp. SCP11 TaxID=3141378 RepID=UPI00333945A2
MLCRKLTGDPPKTQLPKGAVDTQLHIYQKGYSAQPGGPDVPDGCPNLEQYLQVANWLGIDRFIVTVANAYQRDNACLLDVLRQAAGRAVGVGAIHAGTSETELRTLVDAGIVGARVMDLPGGAIGLRELRDVDAKTASFGLAIAVQFDGSHIQKHESCLQSLQSRYVIDHHGKFFCGVTPDSPQVDTLKRLIDRGNCWIKFAGCYESSRFGKPDYADIGLVAREIARYAPDRIVWGTNWPHNMATRTEDYPDDAELLDVVLGWIPGAFRRRALVDNPEELFGLASC